MLPSLPEARRDRCLWVALLLAASLLLLTAKSTASITFAGPSDPNHLHSINLTKCPCAPPCATGTSTLNPDPVVHKAPPAAGSQFMTTFTADQAQYPGWTAVTGAALNGTVTINEYKAVDRMCDCAAGSGCFAGGARLVATYARDATDPNTLTFIQMWYDDYHAAAPAFTYHIDPFPNDDTEPFYYTAEERTHYGLQFVDNPCNWCTQCPKLYVNRFDIYLCSWNATTKQVTVHDGWTWGYDLNCVPEPATVILLLLGALVWHRKTHG